MSPTDAERIAEIRASASREGDTWAHISLFPVELQEYHEQLTVVDFAQMIALSPPTRAVEDLVATRKYRFTDDARDNFREKLAALVGRPPTENE